VTGTISINFADWRTRSRQGDKVTRRRGAGRVDERRRLGVPRAVDEANRERRPGGAGMARSRRPGAAYGNAKESIRMVALAILPLVAAAACTTSKTEAPAIAGPSELGMSLAIAANPDVLTKDGSSQSTIVINVRNSEGQPASGVPLRVETSVAGPRGLRPPVHEVGDDRQRRPGLGRLYRAVGAAQREYPGRRDGADVPGDAVGTNFSNAVPRSITIRLMPAGVILSPADVRLPRFTFAPTSPSEGRTSASTHRDRSTARPVPRTFEQCASVGTKTGLSYAWSFGDGTTGTGVQATHRYATAGSYSVALTVTNDRGNTGSRDIVRQRRRRHSATASFNYSPPTPRWARVSSSTRRRPSRRPVAPSSLRLTFGDGGTGEGATITHRFGTRAPGRSR